MIKNAIKKLFLIFIKFYQVAISPYISPHCRFMPTCSEYAYIAINRFGILKGSYLAIRRI